MSRGSHRKNRSDNNNKNKRQTVRAVEVIGQVQMTREGYVFIKVEGEDNDVFVRATKTKGALNGDTVKAKIKSGKTDKRRREGEIVEILERSTKPFVGILHIVGTQAWVLMQNRFMPYDISVDILDPNGHPFYERKDGIETDYTGALKISGKDTYNVVGVCETINGKSQELVAKKGLKVAVVVDSWDRGEPNPHGHIVDVLGISGENDTEMNAILAEYGLPYRFEPEVENAADKISDKITAKDLKGRRDFTKTVTFTIDPADAKDFDDALSFSKLDNGNYEIGVHIADVSYYVTPDTEVDKEAQSRGTSVYLVDRTIPMLPEKLCNKLCSLRPNENKLTFSAVFEVTPKGKVFNQWFGRTVIRSDYRFAYETAQQIIDNGEAALEMDLRGGTDGIHAPVLDPVLEASPEAAAKRAKLPHVDALMGSGITEGCKIPVQIKEAILRLWDVAKILRDKRFSSGAISFERPEMKVEVDDAGRPIGVHQKISKEANWLIEEYMLLANRSVAEFIATNGKMDGKEKKNTKTFVYRIHDEPNPQKLEGVREFAGSFGYHTNLGEGNGKDVARELNELLTAAKDKPEFAPIEMLALRSMAKACYSTDNIGHYGLAFRFYTHFTSPIRRYPDTMVHRLLGMYLGGAESQNKEYYSAQCTHASEREIIAANAERDSVKYKLVEFMQDKLGYEFEGHISGLTDWGMYVEIEPTKIEGMVALRDIKSDFFEFDEEHYRVVGKRTRIIYRLGDTVKIKVKAANLDQRILDYELVETGLEERESKENNAGSRKKKIQRAIKASKQKVKKSTKSR